MCVLSYVLCIETVIQHIQCLDAAVQLNCYILIAT